MWAVKGICRFYCLREQNFRGVLNSLGVVIESARGNSAERKQKSRLDSGFVRRDAAADEMPAAMVGCQTACKPGSVRTEMRDDHSSGTCLAARLARPTRPAERECSCAFRHCRPYSVLLPVGFALPPLFPGARCALAAPFRPCPRPG